MVSANAIPPGWSSPRSSKKPLVLMPAELFNQSFTRAPDAYLHVVVLRRPPLLVVIAAGVIAVFCGLVAWGILAQAGTTPSMQGAVPYVFAGGFALLGLFFLFSFVNAIAAMRSRGSWSNRQCLAFGRSGIALRVQAAQVDVPWHEVTSIQATVVNPRADRGRRPPVPVIRIERGAEHWELGVAVLDAQPVLVFRLLEYYWRNPARRAELGTTFAQQRMDEAAGVAPTTVGASSAGPAAAPPQDPETQTSST